MKDDNYWKKAYQNTWDQSSSREVWLKKYIEQETGLKLEPCGLGAESTEFITGSANQNEFEKGAADYHVVNTNIYIEVTGSFSKKTKAGDPIWFRPDKLQNAHKHLEDHDTFLANNFKYANEWYVIHYTKECEQYFVNENKNGTDCLIINPIIRGNKEKYIEIKSNNPYVKGLDSLIEYLKNINK